MQRRYFAVVLAVLPQPACPAVRSWVSSRVAGSPDWPPHRQHSRSGQAKVTAYRESEFDLPPLPSPPDADEPLQQPPSRSRPAPLDFWSEPSSDDDLFLPPREETIREGELGGEMGRYGEAGGGRTEGFYAALMESPDRLRASDLNEVLQPDHLDRLRFANSPMQAYGMLFKWDVLIRDPIEVYRQPWALVAADNDLPLPDDEDVMRTVGMRPERAIQQTFRWTDDWGTTQKLAFEHFEKKADMLRTHNFQAADGVLEWLTVLNEYKVPCCVCAGTVLDRPSAESALTRAGLHHLLDEYVTLEDGCETVEESILVSCIKVQRPPERCVVFADDREAVTGAHEAMTKAVAVLSSSRSAGDMRHADMRVSGLDDLSLMSLRELFKGAGPS